MTEDWRNWNTWGAVTAAVAINLVSGAAVGAVQWGWVVIGTASTAIGWGLSVVLAERWGWR